MATLATPSTSRPPQRWSLRKLLSRAFVVFLVGLVVIQIVPFGRNHTNAPIGAEPAWDSPQTRATFMRACADCHSNETRWPWYTNVAPVSWLVSRDVNEGREKFNISEWGRADNEGDESAESVQKGEMPLWFYVPLHPEANLTATEKEQFIQGLIATFGEKQEGPGGGGNESGEDKDKD